MRQRKHPYTLMSDQVCSLAGCTRRIKQNVVDRKPEGVSLTCYRHFIAAKKGRNQ